MNRMRLIVVAVMLAAFTLAAYAAMRAYQNLKPESVSRIPTTVVKRGEVVFTITARGSLQGGNTKVLTAPMTGNSQLVITQLSKSGDLVREGDVVVQFDTTEETFKLREAEADLEEAEQQLEQSKNEVLAREEELASELVQARSAVRLAELECRRNPLIAAIAARQNDLALEAARDKLAKLERDYEERRRAAKASIAIQEAARGKARMLSETAARNISLMTLKAPMGGYASVERNTNSNFFFPGMQFPLLQVGDIVRAGMGVVQIPDLTSWEVTAQIDEQDRGHLAVGQGAEVSVPAVPGRGYKGKVRNLGGTTGPPWNRRFECKLSLDDPSAELRPGMSARVVVRTERLADALWLPAQALFESGARKFVYLRGPDAGFREKDVELVRRSESQVVLTGIDAGAVVALSNPAEHAENKPAPAKGAAGALTK
ncbi:MAG: efflux RND transporter periplasmic adaptor subunit [Bryobacterales bacterium]|nr:efflux RND transporter periplasmic adaptor subunit [Bryobacterales bacterium]